VWLLGSSDYSAQLAASQGLPYVFANHFSGQGLERALDLYRSGYQPSEEHPEPRTFLTVNAVAAPTAEEAEARALPQLRMMARLRLNQPLLALETVEEAVAAESDAATDQVVEAARSRWFVGTGETVAAELRAFAEKYGVDEVMLSPVAASYEAEAKDSSLGRAQTLELIAAAL
jgi:luciferase family oxidoreductase group 1